MILFFLFFRSFSSNSFSTFTDVHRRSPAPQMSWKEKAREPGWHCERREVPSGSRFEKKKKRKNQLELLELSPEAPLHIARIPPVPLETERTSQSIARNPAQDLFEFVRQLAYTWTQMICLPFMPLRRDWHGWWLAFIFFFVLQRMRVTRARSASSALYSMLWRVWPFSGTVGTLPSGSTLGPSWRCVDLTRLTRFGAFPFLSSNLLFE